MPTNEVKAAIGNLNTILLMIVLGVLSWVGYTTQQTAVATAVISATNAARDRELLELRSRMAAVEIGLAQLRRDRAP